MKTFAFDQYIDREFAKKNNSTICNSLEEILSKVDILSLNMNLNKNNYHCINKNVVSSFAKKGLLIVNTARGELVEESAILFGLDNEILSGYLTDVLENEPMNKNHPFIKYENILLTPHIGSRTYESIERQGIKAVKNLVSKLNLYKKYEK